MFFLINFVLVCLFTFSWYKISYAICFKLVYRPMSVHTFDRKLKYTNISEKPTR